MTATHATSLFLLCKKDNSEILTPSLLLPFNQDNPAITAATHAQNLLLYAQIGSANITATHTQNSLLLCVQDDPANSKLHLIVAFILRASTAQTIVESLFLLCDEDNSETMASSLLLFSVKDTPAIMMVTHANYSLQLIVESLFTGAKQVASATIPNESFKLINVSKTSLHFREDCGMFCEGEWEQKRSMDTPALLASALSATLTLQD
jgi:hypothetical protein